MLIACPGVESDIDGIISWGIRLHVVSLIHFL